MSFGQLAEPGREIGDTETVRGAYTHGSGDFRRVTAKICFGSDRLCFHAFGALEKAASCLREQTTGCRAVKEPCTQAFFQRRKASRHRGVVDAKTFRGGQNLPGSGDRKKNSDVIPVHGFRSDVACIPHHRA